MCRGSREDVTGPASWGETWASPSLLTDPGPSTAERGWWEGRAAGGERPQLSLSKCVRSTRPAILQRPCGRVRTGVCARACVLSGVPSPGWRLEGGGGELWFSTFEMLR